MHAWQVHNAKARFSELLEVCLSEGPQMVTKRGVEAAVLVSAQKQVARRSRFVNGAAMYWLDTNVVSESRKNKPHGAVLAWLDSVDEASLFLSAVTIGEIRAGIGKTREQDAEKALALEEWLQ